MALDDSLASNTNVSRRTELAPSRPPGDLERATEAPVVAGELVAAIAHDLRQPLTAIEMNMSAAIALLERPTPRVEDAADALRDALDQERRMRDALEVLQNLAMRREPHRETFDLGAIAREVVALVATDAVARNVPIEVQIAPDLPSVSGDTMLVRQALLNILLYALESASHAGAVRRPVRVAVHRAPRQHGASETPTPVDDDESAEVSIAHFGEPGDRSGTEHWGLALARSVVSAHGATIAFEGDVANGVAVVTRWPMRPPQVAPLPSLADA
jgi:signal transduction histidine kinase